MGHFGDSKDLIEYIYEEKPLLWIFGKILIFFDKTYVSCYFFIYWKKNGAKTLCLILIKKITIY